MSKTIVQTDQAPAPIGPYSQAVIANGMVYLSGQVAIDPQSGLMSLGNLASQAKLVMENIRAVLEAAGSNFDQVVKSTIFLAPGEDFGVVNTIYGEYFTNDFPARETVWVHTLPKNARVEISMIALVA